jgi:alkanesulfonate monooxygenase SsuD/methylene tetrahydromethanopterin reductase-like flavin-dependent oxidoreductase (luciferase family)
MRFITITLIVHAPDPFTGAQKSTRDRFREVLGKGNGAAQRELFNVTPEDQWDRNAESFEVFRRLWQDNKITYDALFRPPLHEAEAWPRPLQRPVRIWHGSATSKASVDLAARHGGTAGYYSARNSQDAIEAYRPVFAGHLAFQNRLGLQPVFPTLEDFVERSSALIGSPAQVIEKVYRYHEKFGHSVLHLHADAGGLTDSQHRASLELFQSDIAPVLRREIPDPPWGWGGGPLGDDTVPGGYFA